MERPLKHTQILCLCVLVLVAGCGAEDDGGAADAARATPVAGDRPAGAQVYGDPNVQLTSEELERGRMDPGWRSVVQIDSANAGSGSNPEKWEDISAQAVNQNPMHLPLAGDVAGPSVLRTQILLDRALFSPGVMDGRWGKNTEKAVYWFQRREGLRANGQVDEATFQRLQQAAGAPQQLIREHALSAKDVEGPFLEIPEDIYEKAQLECMCYESLREKLGELFHATPELLEQLNPGVELNALKAGDRIQVPQVRANDAAPSGKPERLVISDGGFYLHALDAQGRVLYHFPTTLGSDYAPSPSGDFKIVGIAQDPTWHYQPGLLTGVPDEEEDAVIPPGPNNAVGVVWMELSKPHYGIHGTSAPETIGYTTSHGCVRLTNWDARFLSQQIAQGIPVEFRDVDNRGGKPNAQGVE